MILDDFIHNIPPKKIIGPPKILQKSSSVRRGASVLLLQQEIPEKINLAAAEVEVLFQGLVTVPFWVYWTSPYSSHYRPYTQWLGDVKNGDI
jgi:hypothetical protein